MPYATGNAAHDAAVIAAEAARQAGPPSKAVDIAFHKAVVASAKANLMVSHYQSREALRELQGTEG